MPFSRWFAWLAMGWVLFWPAAAWACPDCALDGGPSSRLWVVIGMLAMPFLIALFIVPIVRRAIGGNEDEEDLP